MDKNRFKSMTGFLDMLWILLAGFGAMFIIAYLMIQPPAKTADIIKKAEYIVVLGWDSEVGDDIDLWVRSPKGVTVCFRNKTGGFMNLEKDDLGRQNDTIMDEFGNRIVLKINREIITLRGVHAGEYEVMIHVYNREMFQELNAAGVKSGKLAKRTGPIKYTVEVIKINPYKIVYVKEGVYEHHKQEISIVRFKVDDDAEFISFNNKPSDIIQMSMRSSYDANTTRADGTPIL
tara:strand:+ start:1730 stop:2428 length:699 start_codon:yes stop_codon:yes gene_type:complete